MSHNYHGLAQTLLASGAWPWAVKTVLARRKTKLDEATKCQNLAREYSTMVTHI